MSLNSCEQKTFDYLRGQPDERRFWQDKVRKAAAAEPAEAAARLERELWAYFEERSRALPAWREAAQREGLKRTSMRNLAELLLRLWTEPRPKKRAEGPEGEARSEF
jgi:hypothetical protein